jgi:hypothetical protein
MREKMCNRIDNVSYAKEIFIKNKRIEKLGEHVIKKDTLETIIGLMCVGFIPELSSMKIEHNEFDELIAEITIPAIDNLISFKMNYENKLSSYVILKDIKFKSYKENVKISNINIRKILMVLSSGTFYSDIDKEGDEYRLTYLDRRKEG